MSEFQTQGLTIHVFKPTYVFNAVAHTCVSTLEGTHLADLSQDVVSYQHSLGMVGGFLSCSFTLAVRQVDLEMWMDKGPGCHIVVSDDSGVLVWEGFVDSVQLSIAGLTITRGPVLDIGNQVLLTYTIEDTSTAPPTESGKQLSVGSENTSSIEIYGVCQKIINAGNQTAVTAAQYLNLWVLENAFPRTTQDIDLSGAGNEPSISFRCLGYANRLNYYYQNTVGAGGSVTGTSNISTKIAAILNYDKGGLFASTNALITTNTTQVRAYEGDWTDAWTLLRDLVALGDATYNRYRFMIGEDRYIRYEPVPTAVRYYQTLSDPKQAIYDVGGGIVKPWRVQPGEWLRITDWLPALDDGATFRTDPRYMLIEQVDYDLPWGVRLVSGRSDRLTQYLAQRGLEGAA